ncbi:FMN-binding negative transcriptional regulator [Rhizobium sp. LjRoot254]|uniref:FMN-binding negative transcriptional regulator n=1 Tax=Rhizobium sp. LjRoot254 TaxID=3342297 RepID=UPI003ED0E16B
MYQPPLFREERLEVLHGLMRAHPFGLIISAGSDGEPVANAIPLLLDSSTGEKGMLRGHLARANPHWKLLAETGKALIVFQGPYSYVTPSWYETKKETGKVVPTWNYAIVQARGAVKIHEDAGWLRAHVGALTDSHEAGRADPWAVSDAPESFIDSQLKGIVGFEIEISSLEGKWKVSQNRPVPDRVGVVEGLVADGGDGNAEMVKLVREYGGLS